MHWRSIVEVEVGPSVVSLYLRPWRFWIVWVNGRLELGHLDSVFRRIERRFDRRTRLWKMMRRVAAEGATDERDLTGGP